MRLLEPASDAKRIFVRTSNSNSHDTKNRYPVRCLPWPNQGPPGSHRKGLLPSYRKELPSLQKLHHDDSLRKDCSLALKAGTQIRVTVLGMRTRPLFASYVASAKSAGASKVFRIVANVRTRRASSAPIYFSDEQYASNVSTPSMTEQANRLQMPP